MAHYLLQTDGAITKNPGGQASYGFILYRDGLEIKRAHGIIGEGPGMTNNLAEYYALAEGLSYYIGACHTPSDTVVIHTDATLVEKQMQPGYILDETNPKPYTPYAVKSKRLFNALKNMGVNISIRWIPRELNQDCDDLSKAHRLPK